MLTDNDFALTDEELRRINGIVAREANAYAATGNDPGDGVTVIFEFSPFGRIIAVSYAGGPYTEIDLAPA